MAQFQRKNSNSTSESAPHHEKSSKNQEFRLNFANFFEFFAKFHDFSLEISSAPSNLASYKAPRILAQKRPFKLTHLRTLLYDLLWPPIPYIGPYYPALALITLHWPLLPCIGPYFYLFIYTP